MPIFALDQGWLVGDVSTIALIFIMFYGGFGTRWKSARPVVVEAGLLATIGVALTALFVGMFCHWVMGWEWLESLLMGAVIGSAGNIIWQIVAQIVFGAGGGLIIAQAAGWLVCPAFPGPSVQPGHCPLSLRQGKL